MWPFVCPATHALMAAARGLDGQGALGEDAVRHAQLIGLAGRIPCAHEVTARGVQLLVAEAETQDLAHLRGGRPARAGVRHRERERKASGRDRQVAGACAHAVPESGRECVHALRRAFPLVVRRHEHGRRREFGVVPHREARFPRRVARPLRRVGLHLRGATPREPGPYED
jgi:hypothetical protein